MHSSIDPDGPPVPQRRVTANRIGRIGRIGRVGGAACAIHVALSLAPSARAQLATAQPAATRTPLPPAASIVGVLPECTLRAALTPSHEAVLVGDPVTLTVTTDVACPQHLDRRAAVVVVGSRTHASILDVRASLSLLVERVAAGRGTRLAIIEVGAAAGPAPWASTADEFEALGRRVRRLEVRNALDDADWLDAAAAAEALLGAARPSEQPLLVVLDSWGPVSGRARVVERLQRLAFATRDRAGHVWLLDVSTTGWLAARIIRPVPADSTVVALFPAADLDGTLEPLLMRLLASAAAPIALVDVILDANLTVSADVPSTHPVPVGVASRRVHWRTPGRGHEMMLRHSAVFRTTGPHTNGGATGIVRIERTLPALRTLQRIQAFLCVGLPSPSPDACRRGALPPTEAPQPNPTAAARGTGTATRTTTPDGPTAPPPATPTPYAPEPSATATSSATAVRAQAHTAFLPWAVRER